MPWFIKDVAKEYQGQLRRLVPKVTLKRLAEDADVPWKPMCNALLGCEPLNDDRVDRIVAAIAYHTDLPFREVYDRLVAPAVGKPDPPPDQPMAPVGPQPRRDGSQRPAPSRGRPERDNRRPSKRAAVAS